VTPDWARIRFVFFSPYNTAVSDVTTKNFVT
jgi:hypothetical protein